jgi:hypothetical protein
MRYKLVWLLVCAATVTACTPKQQHEEPQPPKAETAAPHLPLEGLTLEEQVAKFAKLRAEEKEQWARHPEIDRARYEKDLDAHPATFPEVKIGMTYKALHQQISELNPDIRKPNSDEQFNLVGIERIVKTTDFLVVTFWLLDAKTNTKAYAKVTVSKPDNIVVGYSR